MIYSFEDKETGEEFVYDLTYEQLQEFLVDFPNLVQTFRINIADPVGMGITKPPSDFQKYVLGRIKETAPGAKKDVIEKRWHIPKEV